MMAGIALQKFRRHTTGLWRLEQSRQSSSDLHPDCSMGWAAHATWVVCTGITGHQSLYCSLLYRDSGC